MFSTYCFLLRQSTYYQNNLQTEQKQTPGKDATCVIFVKNKSKTHAFVLSGLFQEEFHSVIVLAIPWKKKKAN